ncbi:hypothetical protein D3C78_1953100 [compost metagenome]
MRAARASGSTASRWSRLLRITALPSFMGLAGFSLLCVSTKVLATFERIMSWIDS